ncbi:HesB/IscA family protein [Inmirania thermothiophila]|uniref:Iron-binding apoprotein IscA n=1 Tax=Inmirania thermothiophila TaxID=1750597 RepID=A0A3N1XTZ9_9GAMM|nr:iron-sulfur cluster assembly accessory protein [Inmirania thermothiophila]ROR29738.1 iron-binding apoprotein IscA [Inmirania thermothiophila]
MAIRLTEAARERVRGFLAQDGSAVGLRLGVRAMGCSGYSYVMDLAREVGEDDVVFEDDGVRVVVDRESLRLLDGTEVDFAREGLSEGFRFRNPNVRATCGCGDSFTV